MARHRRSSSQGNSDAFSGCVHLQPRQSIGAAAAEVTEAIRGVGGPRRAQCMKASLERDSAPPHLRMYVCGCCSLTHATSTLYDCTPPLRTGSTANNHRMHTSCHRCW
jgi:hypothetical protein